MRPIRDVRGGANPLGRAALRIGVAYLGYLLVHPLWSSCGAHELWRSLVLSTGTKLLPVIQHFPVVSDLNNLDIRNMDFVVILALCLFAVSIRIPIGRRLILFGSAIGILMFMNVVAVLLQSQVTAAQELLAKENLILYLPTEFKLIDRLQYFFYDFGMEASTFALLAASTYWNDPAIVSAILPLDSRTVSGKMLTQRGGGKTWILVAASCVAGFVVAGLVWVHVRESNPYHSATHARLGNLFLQARNTNIAETQYRAAIAGRTVESSAWMNLAGILKSRGDAAEADRILRDGLAIVTEPVAKSRIEDMIRGRS